jgi:hypothetical protein
MRIGRQNAHLTGSDNHEATDDGITDATHLANATMNAHRIRGRT